MTINQFRDRWIDTYDTEWVGEEVISRYHEALVKEIIKWVDKNEHDIDKFNQWVNSEELIAYLEGGNVK